MCDLEPEEWREYLLHRERARVAVPAPRSRLPAEPTPEAPVSVEA